ncbi:hypothetical protein BGW38_004470, partial [Lunasporangiospora selenospora]
CTRMFSRFDNMVQHTQTHTKGTRRETSAGIASKIALESRRKSEAGLLGTGRGGGGAGHGRIPRKKRGSMSSTSGSEAGAQSLARKGRVNSMPLLRAGGGATDAKERAHATTGRHGLESRDNCRARKRILPSSSSTASLDLNTGSDATRSPSTVAEASEETSPAMTPTADSAKSPAPARKGSLSSSNPSSNSTTLSWYASKLHHKPSFDIGLSQYDRTLGLDAHLPPWNNRYEYPIDAPGYHHRPRHPLSPERSSHSEEDEDDEDSDDPRQLPSLSTGRRDEWHTRQQPQKSWRGSVDSIDNCTLPPLRPNGLDELDRPPRQHQYNPQPYSRFSGSARLPSISRSGYCSFGAGEDQKSGTHGLHGRYRSNGSDGLDEDDLNDEIDDLESHVKVEIREQDHDQDFGTERYAPKARRLSLVDLERPIQETREALDHSISVQQAKFEGVDVSEDEIQALEAFGELWSQGRDVDMDIDAAAAVVAVVSKKIGGGVAGGGVGELIHPALVVAKMVPVRNEIEPHALGSDRGRRSPRPSHTAERDAATSLEFLRSSEVRAMEVD